VVVPPAPAKLPCRAPPRPGQTWPPVGRSSGSHRKQRGQVPRVRAKKNTSLCGLSGGRAGGRERPLPRRRLGGTLGAHEALLNHALPLRVVKPCAPRLLPCETGLAS
jgi:hypothetical protein